MNIVKTIFSAVAALFATEAVSQNPVTPPSDFYAMSFKTITGETFKFDNLKGKKVLIVNTASKCGYTPQFEELEQMSQEYKGKLVILGFPSNDFGAQDPGTNEQIKEFCEMNYGVSFMMMEKSSVKGADKNSIYKWLSEKAKNGWNTTEPSWNFGKYLIDEKGRLVGFYPSKVKPMDPKITENLK
jgi:glutathione peroxidase